MKIGVFVYTDKIRLRHKENRTYFDNVKYIGLRRILSEIKDKHEIIYVSRKTLNDVDFVLVPIISYRDYFNILHELNNVEVNTRIIFGGPGLFNPFPLEKIAYAIVIGRAENMIEGILEGVDYENVYYPEKGLSRKLKVGQLKEFIEFGEFDRKGEMPKHFKHYKERHIGCAKKCYFCHYTWRNKLIKSDDIKGYRSGFNDCENTIGELEWPKKKHKYLITAIDSLTEKARIVVNRGNITNERIERTFEKFYECGFSHRLKLYCVIAYPFETQYDLNLFELINICKKVDRRSKNKLQVWLSCTHFVPMIATPMEAERVNMINARAKIDGNYDGQSIKLVLLKHEITHYVSALEQTFINRYKPGDDKYMKILLSRKYNKLQSHEKAKVFKEFIPDRFYSELEDIYSDKFIEPVYDIRKARKAYKKRVEEYYKVVVE